MARRTFEERLYSTTPLPPRAKSKVYQREKEEFDTTPRPTETHWLRNKAGRVACALVTELPSTHKIRFLVRTDGGYMEVMDEDAFTQFCLEGGFEPVAPHYQMVTSFEQKYAEGSRAF